ASKAGLQAGDSIVKVDGQPLTQLLKFVTFVRDNPGRPLALEIERQGSALSLTLTPDTRSVNGKAEGFAGVVPKIIPQTEEYKSICQYGPFSPILEATDNTCQLISLMVRTVGKLITGSVKLNNLRW
ncbi:PDZ domain-containing protein, partial [Salmonella enterica]|uniref:PDZ domain-containing protein n=1 Tax=Salmonella enterica TaxID=28901 RepID=UPI00398C289B